MVFQKEIDEELQQVENEVSFVVQTCTKFGLWFVVGKPEKTADLQTCGAQLAVFVQCFTRGSKSSHIFAVLITLVW